MKPIIYIMKRLLAVCAVAFAATMPLLADTETVGGYTWTYQINGDTAEIRGVSPSSDAVTIPSILGGKPVTSIGADAFYNCSGLTSVAIPDGVTSIGDSAFYGCRGLTSVTIPDGVTNIGSYAFYDCSRLTSVTIPDGVKNIPSYMFSSCSRLADVMIGNGVTNIGSYAFQSCSALTSITMPASVTGMGAAVFDSCSNLREVYYLGDAPTVDGYLYRDRYYSYGYYYYRALNLTSYVLKGTRRWDGIENSRALPEKWPAGSYGCDIEYWEANTFDLVFDGNGGTPATNVFEEGAVLGTLPQPTYGWHVFQGWFTELVGGEQVTAETVVECPATYYAQWSGTYTIAFYSNGGKGSMTSLAMIEDEAKTLPSCAFVRLDHDFAGWATEEGGDVAYADGSEVVNLTDEPGGVVWLFAVWTPRMWSAGEALNVKGLAFADGGDLAWTLDSDASHDGTCSMRSGAIGAAEEGGRTQSVMTTTVLGEGSGTFWWKVNCEEPYNGEWHDYVSFAVDGVEKAKIAGDTGWQKVAYTVNGAGEHVLSWTFTRDDWDEPGDVWENCAWVDELAWTPKAVTVSFGAGAATEGAVPSPITAYAGAEIVLPGAGTLARPPYVFGGWSDGLATYAAGDTFSVKAQSETLTAVWTLDWTLENAVGAAGLTFATGGDGQWFVSSPGRNDDVLLRSGAIDHSQETWIETSVTGPGTMSFWWKVAGEVNRSRLYDYAKVTLDGEIVHKAGNTDWTNLAVQVASGGPHTIRWTYLKNGSVSVADDCAWMDNVRWVPSGAAGLATWLAERNLTADAPAANGRTAAECYALGLDPTLATNDFRIVSIELVDGKPQVEWEPKTNRWTGAEIPAVLKGAATPEGPWDEVPAGGNPAFRFFRVTVEMP